MKERPSENLPTPPGRYGLRLLASFGPWGGVALLGAWTRWSSAWLLLGAAVLLVGAVLAERRRSRLFIAGLVVLLLSTAAGFMAEGRLQRLAREWPAVWSAREEAVGAELDQRLDALIASGEGAVDTIASRLAASPDASLGELLDRVLEDAAMDALAVYGPDGELRAWTGSHRGPVPESARLGLAGYIYGEGPLFGYLYVTAPLEATDGTAVAATLIRADLPPGVDDPPRGFASRFRGTTGETLRVSRAERIRGDAVWDLRWEEETLFSVGIVQPSQADRMDRVRLRWTRPVALGVLLSWMLLITGARREAWSRRVGGACLLFLGAVLPLGRLLGIRELVSPADFLLPGPLDVTLGPVLGLCLAGAAVAGMAGARLEGGDRPVLAGAIALLGLPSVAWLLREGTSLGFVTGGEGEWIAYQGGLALAMALVVALALMVGRPPATRPGAPLGVALGWVGTVLLSLLAAFRVEGHPVLPWWVPALWTVPVVWLARRGLGGEVGVRKGALLWASAILVGTSAALPMAWGDRIEARMADAEEEIQRLGLRADPYLEFLLLRMLERQDALDAQGASPVEVLYRGWVDSGLAREGYPLWLTLWSPEGSRVEELRIGVNGSEPPSAVTAMEAFRGTPGDTVVRLQSPDAHYLAEGALPSGSSVTALVPPRRSLGLGTPLGPLFASGRPGPDPLTLVPLTPDELDEANDSVRWVRSGEGRQAEFFLSYPDGVYHGHYEFELPGPLLEAARALLLLVANAAVLMGLWAVGRFGAGPPRSRPPDLRLLVGSFRSRLTLTLFVFFLLPTLVFGTLAYRTLSGASVRTAGTLAERTVDEAAERWAGAGAVDLLGRQVRGELLLYRRGSIVGGSAEALVDLGLYEGWIPPGIHRSMERGEELLTTSSASLGSWEYVVAYRRLPGGDVLAAPAPLQAGATALRRGEVTHLLAFALVLGAALSVGLALLAGRTLYRPIQTLQVASERVGRGNLKVKLPRERSDEFGAVFEAFNRMVLRLRRARRALVRTTRRTQAIVEEAATGVVALDPQGRVTLVNPRAQDLLSSSIPVGESLPAGEGAPGELARWVEIYFRDGLEEDGTELQVGERRIRVRARRITRGGPLSGAVVSLEDVTDELRAERILAWGEMARQVAHEVKNPLTPMQLSVQHIRRAWEDRRPDFGKILTANVEAVLREIDRLAGIARSFSRFGAPLTPSRTPLAPVPVYSVAKEILALYGGGEGAIRFENRVPKDLPRARAREPELKEVLVNLLENARAAVSPGGTVAVEAEAVSEGVELRVRDDGSGIPAEVLPRVFEPHFSTRSTGTGLGLAIVRRLVESWEGSVSAESREGEGTVIRILLGAWSDPDR